MLILGSALTNNDIEIIYPITEDSDDGKEPETKVKKAPTTTEARAATDSLIHYFEASGDNEDELN